MKNKIGLFLLMGILLVSMVSAVRFSGSFANGTVKEYRTLDALPKERCDIVLPATEFRDELVYKNAGIYGRFHDGIKCFAPGNTKKKVVEAPEVVCNNVETCEDEIVCGRVCLEYECKTEDESGNCTKYTKTCKDWDDFERFECEEYKCKSGYEDETGNCTKYTKTCKDWAGCDANKGFYHLEEKCNTERVCN